MGLVYRAEDLRLKRQVALKLLPPEMTKDPGAKERFIREAQAASALDHPNICTIHEIDETENGQMFIVMACYEGETLRQKISRGPLGVEEAVGVALQILSGLQRTHENNIIHRDIKPENAMIVRDGVVKIVDFGIAKLAGESHLTNATSVLGTTAYMSPEQVRGDELDPRSDIWSVGVVLYEMLAGHPPFQAPYEQSVLYQILNKVEDPLTSLRPEVPGWLEGVIRKAMQKDPAARYAGAGEMIASLKSSGEAPPEAPALRPGLIGGLARWKYRMPAAAVALLLVAALVVMKLYPSRPGDTSIAVLPLVNLSDAKDDEYFSDGVTEDIIGQLSKIGSLRVISRAAVMGFKGRERNIAEIAGRLGVSKVLDGSVRRSGGRVRITVELTDAAGGERLWGETYDRQMTDIFSIQSDVAGQIASAIKMKLTPEETRKILKRPTDNLDAYDYYLKGREYYHHFTKSDNENAVTLFCKALSLDSGFALVLAGLADAYSQRFARFGYPRLWSDSAASLSRRAIAIDPGLAEGYKALGFVYAGRGRLRQALDEYRRAIDLNPNYASAVGNFGWTSLYVGDLSTAIEYLTKAVALDPTTVLNYSALGVALSLAGDSARARYWLDRAVDLQQDEKLAHIALGYLYLEGGDSARAVEEIRYLLSKDPLDPDALSIAGDMELFSGRLEEAEAYYSRVHTADPSVVPWLTGISSSATLGYIGLKLGKTEEAGGLLTEAVSLSKMGEVKGNEWYYIPYNLAAVSAIQGKAEEALAALSRAVDAGWRNVRLTALDPRFGSLRADARFRQILDALAKRLSDERSLASRGGL